MKRDEMTCKRCGGRVYRKPSSWSDGFWVHVDTDCESCEELMGMAEPVDAGVLVVKDERPGRR